MTAGAWLQADVSRLVEWFPAHRLADGGWNCEAEEGDSTRSSFHSTLNAVRGVLAYERLTGDTSLRGVRHEGEEYLLKRRLLFPATTGEPAGEFATQLIHPNRHRYSALAAFVHFREAALLEGSTPDPLLGEAIGVVRAARAPDGTWQQEGRLPWKTWLDVDVPRGEPSKWLTLWGIRVLDWWEGKLPESV